MRRIKREYTFIYAVENEDFVYYKAVSIQATDRAKALRVFRADYPDANLHSYYTVRPVGAEEKQRRFWS